MPEAVKTTLAQQPTITMRGCLIAFWQSQPLSEDYGHPVTISANGIAELDQGQNGGTGLQLPPSSLDHPLLFRLYLLTVDRSKALASDPDGHAQLCRAMKSTSYDCFANVGECWMAFELQPDVVFRGKTLKTLPVTDDENVRCRACVHEICGDGIDNDCNGKVDDIDGLKKVQCTKTD